MKTEKERADNWDYISERFMDVLGPEIFPVYSALEDAQEWVDLQLLSRGRIPPTLEDLEKLRDMVYKVDLGRKVQSSIRSEKNED